MLDPSQGVFARGAVRRTPARNAPCDLQAQASAGHGLVIAFAIDEHMLLQPVIPLPVAAIHPLLVGRDAGRKTAGVVDRINAFAAQIGVCPLGRDDPVVARSGVDAVDPGIAFQLVGEARAD
ncbi:hypothetical protein D3C85_1288750 [compost metagenome]